MTEVRLEWEHLGALADWLLWMAERTGHDLEMVLEMLFFGVGRGGTKSVGTLFAFAFCCLICCISMASYFFAKRIHFKIVPLALNAVTLQGR